MPRNKVLEKAKVNVSASRSAVDLSQDRSQTALAGEIQMVYCQPFVKGSRGKINRKCFTRTAQVVSPAFHRITEHYDFFMVPLHALWRPWENWKLNLNDMQDTRIVPWNSTSNEVDLTLPAVAPRLDFTQILHNLGVFASVNPQSPTPQSDIQRQCRIGNDALRIMDEARYGDDHDDPAYATVPNVMSLFGLAAYQKCYYEHYRNTAYESNNPYAYNLDWLTYEGTSGVLTPDYSDSTKAKHTKVALELFKRRRVNYRNDYFHNLYPSINYVISQPSGTQFVIPSNICGASSSNNNNVWRVEANPYSNGNVGIAQYSGNFSNNQVITVQSIRASFALDKLLRAAAYAPKHVREQYKAQFGVDGKPYDDDMRSQRLGSFQSDVVLQEVTNMTQSATADLGDLGAKGVGASGKDMGISFYCEQDCLIVGLRYFMPRARYDNDGIHPWNAKIVREDFYQKAFENLGLRPFIYGNIDSFAPSRNNVIGWTVPNYEYKIAPDLNMDCFKLNFKEVKYAVQSGVPTAQDTTSQSSLSTFVPHTSAPLGATSGSGATAEYFKVAPEDLDTLFVDAVPADHNRSIYQFFSDIRIELAAVIPMSLHGQPGI